MPLSDTAVRLAKPSDKEYFLNDGLGLYLRVRPAGKTWFYRFTLDGSRKKVSLGSYPAVSLKEARAKRLEAESLVEKGINPIGYKGEPEDSAEVADLSFMQMVNEWLKFREPTVTVSKKGSQEQCILYMNKDVFPVLGHKPAHTVTRPDLLKVIAAIEERRAFTVADKMRTWLNQLYRYAVVKEYVPTNCATDLSIVAAVAPHVTHNPWLELDELGEFVRRLRVREGSFAVTAGIKILLYTGIRTGELRKATWDRVDFEKGLLTVPASHLKQFKLEIHRNNKKIPDYIVPLSKQALEVLKELKELTGVYGLLLPGRDDYSKPVSENTINKAVKELGYEGRLTGHGLRATLSTALNEMGWPSDWVEAQLSHTSHASSASLAANAANKDKVLGEEVRLTYNHARYIEQRRRMMQFWADYLDELAASTQPFDPATMPQFLVLTNELY